MDNKKLKNRAAWLSIISNTLLVSGKLAVGIITNSVGIISEAVHSGIDLVASFVTFASVRVADKPADKEHPYGHGKFENLSAIFEAILIFLAAGLILSEALGRLSKPEELDTLPLGIALMGIAALQNLVVSTWMLKVAKKTDSIALEADAKQLQTDIYTAGGVFLGLIIMHFTRFYILDPIIAIVVAAMITRTGFVLMKKAAEPLMDMRLPDEDQQKLSDIVMGTPDVVGYHKMRTRKSGARREMDIHLILQHDLSLVDAHNIAEHVEDKIRDAFPDVHVITHIEPETEEEKSKPDTHIK